LRIAKDACAVLWGQFTIGDVVNQSGFQVLCDACAEVCAKAQDNFS